MTDNVSFFSSLTVAVNDAGGKPELFTKDFADACMAIMPFFDHLGTVFHYAKRELSGKAESMVKAASQYELLEHMIAADKQAATATMKGSNTRNLHRLTKAMLFIRVLLHEFVTQPGISLAKAAEVGYQQSLAEIHATAVRAVVKTGIWALPSRESFLKSVRESEETAAEKAHLFIAAADRLLQRVQQLLVGIDFPPSNAWFISS